MAKRKPDPKAKALATPTNRDGACIDKLMQLGSNVATLDSAEKRAAQKLLNYDGEVYPSDGCAITLSTLLQDAGIDVPDIYTAIELGAELRDKRNWQVVDVGHQQQGDVGSTCGLNRTMVSTTFI